MFCTFSWVGDSPGSVFTTTWSYVTGASEIAAFFLALPCFGLGSLLSMTATVDLSGVTVTPDFFGLSMVFEGAEECNRCEAVFGDGDGFAVGFGDGNRDGFATGFGDHDFLDVTGVRDLDRDRDLDRLLLRHDLLCDFFFFLRERFFLFLS